MILTWRKLRRELLAQPGQSLAVSGVTALGVMLFVTSAGAYRDLRDSYAATRAKLALASLQVDVASVDDGGLARVRALEGVALAEPRLVVDVPAAMPGGRATFRLISLPEEGGPRLDRPLVLEGALPGPGQVLVEKHFAEAHGLRAGSTLFLGAGAGPLAVSGVAVSPEYLWVVRDENDFMPTPKAFGVGWLRRSSQRQVAQALLDGGASALASDAVKAAASDSAGNQVLVELAPGRAAAPMARPVEAALGPTPARATPSEDLVGVTLMQLDLDGYKGMAAFFPFFFLGIGAFIVGSALARLVDAQRSVIGTLLALGFGRAALLGHYAAYAVTLGGAGALAGAVLGQAASPALTREYAQELGIPFVEWHVHLDLLAWGLVMGLAVALGAGLFPALSVMRLTPAAAMRPTTPRVGALARLLRRGAMPLPLRLALRDVLGRPGRSLGTALGVAAAIVLVLSTGVLLDSMRVTLDSLFAQAQTYDVRVDFAALSTGAEALSTARAVAGVRRAETLLALPATLAVPGHEALVLVQALADDQRLVRSVDVDGGEVAPAPGGLTLTRAVARKLGVQPGSPVRLQLPRGWPSLELIVTGFADAAMGSVASVRLADLSTRLPVAGLSTSLLVAVDAGHAARVRAALEAAFPQAVKVEDATATRAMFEQLMGLGWVMLASMLLFGGLLAAAILFNTATLTVLEHQRDLATLRALGVTMREITALLTLEHGLLTALGIALGVPLAMASAQAMLRAFQSELFSLPFVLRAPTVAVTLAGVVVTVLLAQWPALLRVGKSSLAEAVRTREG